MKSKTTWLVLLLAFSPVPTMAAVSRYNYRVVSSGSAAARIPQFIICDTVGELPATLVADGDLAYTKDTDIMWSRAAGAWVDITSGGSSGHVIEDEGTPLTARANLNFAGAGVTCTDSAPDTLCTISGGGAGAPTTAEYVTASLDAVLSAERVLTAGTNTTIDTSVASQIKVNLSGTHADAFHTDAYSGVGACGANTVATTLNDTAAPTCTALTDAYIPNTITVDLATLATTATTANAGDSATSFFGAGLLEVAVGGTGSAPAGDDQLLVSAGIASAVWKTIPACDDIGGSHLNYVIGTNSFTCGTTAGQATTGDSATAFFGAGLLEVAIGGTGSAPASGDQVLVSDGVAGATWKTIPDCDNALTSKLLYDQTTHSWSCGTDQAGSGSTPTGTGYAHVTGGVYDAAALALIPLVDITDAAGSGSCLVSGGGFGDPNWGSCSTADAPVGAKYIVAEANAALSAEVAPGADDQVPLSSSSTSAVWVTIPDCDSATTGSALNYDQTTNTFTCANHKVVLVSGSNASDAVIATYTAVPNIAFTPAANTRYRIECMIIYTSTAATTGINFAWDVPTGINFIHMLGDTKTVATGANEGFNQRADNVGTNTSASVITVQNIARLDAILSNGATSTSTTLGFTPETANSVTVIAGSMCEYWIY